MHKNILYISYDGLTDQLGQSQILPYIIGLTEVGYNFTIISAEKPEIYDKEKKNISKICKENNIDWKPVKYTKKPPVLSTIKDIKKIRKLAYKLHKQKQFYAVHCRSYIPAIIGLKMQQKYGVKFIFDMRGFWADERIDGKIWDLSKHHYRLIYKYFKKKEKEFLQNADAIVSLTHIGKKIMQEEWKVKKPIYVIPCAVDTNLFKPDNKENLQSQNQKSELTLGYLGSIGTWYMLDEMLDFFKVLLEKYPKAKFKFITKEEPAIILNKAIARNININSFDISSAQRNEVANELSKIDVGIFFIKSTFSKQASSPVKQGEFMAMGIPVIANSGVGDTDNIINKYDSGMLIKEFTYEEYRRVVDLIPEKIKENKVSILKGADEYFSLKNGVNTYSQLYKKL
jgi:glycosyltransferase involved in cell wall biosynthesis